MAARPADPTAPSPTTAFFYGTLMSPAVLTRVTSRPPSSFKTRPALLPDHRRHRVKRADFPAIMPAKGSMVRGTYVEGLNESDVFRLDTFEGSMYERRNVKVRLIMGQKGGASAASKSSSKDDAPKLPPGTQTNGTGPGAPPPQEDELEEGEVDTATYVWIDPVSDLEEEEWDFAEFVREKLWRWAGKDAELQGEYAEVDEAVKQQENDKPGHDPTGGRFVGGDFDRRMNGS